LFVELLYVVVSEYQSIYKSFFFKAGNKTVAEICGNHYYLPFSVIKNKSIILFYLVREENI